MATAREAELNAEIARLEEALSYATSLGLEVQIEEQLEAVEDELIALLQGESQIGLVMPSSRQAPRHIVASVVG